MSAITKRLTVFRSVGGLGTEIVFHVGSNDSYTPRGYVRVSEFVEVTFPPLAQDTVIQQQLAVLDEAERKARVDFQQLLDQITNARQQLLALPAPAGESS